MDEAHGGVISIYELQKSLLMDEQITSNRVISELDTRHIKDGPFSITELDG